MLRAAPLVALLASALLAPAAYAQGGAGLYKPFPGGTSAGLAKRYLDRLPASETKQLTSAEIRRGVFVARAGMAGSRAASVRAGRRGDGGGSLPPVLSLGIVGVAAGGGFALASRRR
jgi:hypothetical protein